MNTKTITRMLPLLIAPVVVGCQGFPVSTSIDDVNLVAPVSMKAGAIIESQAYVFQEAPLFSAAIDDRLNDIGLSGKATLSKAADSKLVLDVMLAEDLNNLDAICVDLGDYLGCAGQGNSQKVGSIVVDAGQTVGTVNMSGSYLDKLAHEGKGHIGLHIQEGSLDAGTELKLTELIAKAKAGLI